MVERSNLGGGTFRLDTSIEVAAVSGANGDDVLTVSPGLVDLKVSAEGNEGDDTFIGNGEKDDFVGGPGRDRLTAGRGSDALDGGGDDDLLFARDGDADEIHGGEGFDTAHSDGVTVDTVDGVESLDPVEPVPEYPSPWRHAASAGSSRASAHARPLPGTSLQPQSTHCSRACLVSAGRDGWVRDEVDADDREARPPFREETDRRSVGLTGAETAGRPESNRLDPPCALQPPIRHAQQARDAGADCQLRRGRQLGAADRRGSVAAPRPAQAAAARGSRRFRQTLLVSRSPTRVIGRAADRPHRAAHDRAHACEGRSTTACRRRLQTSRSGRCSRFRSRAASCSVIVVERALTSSDVAPERIGGAARARRAGDPGQSWSRCARWIADEYCSTVARALQLVLPPGVGRAVETARSGRDVLVAELDRRRPACGRRTARASPSASALRSSASPRRGRFRRPNRRRPRRPQTPRRPRPAPAGAACPTPPPARAGGRRALACMRRG